MAWIAASICLSTLYGANESRKARESAENDQRNMLAQQASDQAAMRTELGKQTAEYAKQGASLAQQAQTAKDQFESSQANYATNKNEMEKTAKEVQASVDEERRKAAASEASALKARTRGGRRSLLSNERMNAELGVPVDLSNGGMRLQ